MKIVVIGCTHAGTSAVVNAVKLYPNAEITVYERNDNISFLSCGIALYIEKIVEDVNGLFYSSPKKLESLGVNAKMRHEVLSVDFDAKRLSVKNLETAEEFEDYYDKLIITTGSWPIVPSFKGIDLENVMFSKNFEHAQALISKTNGAKNVVVVGAGYIGVELAEAFRENGKNVTLVDIEPRVVAKYFDPEFTEGAEKALLEKGVNLALGEKVVELVGENGKVAKVITDKNEYLADLVVLSIGFTPSAKLFEGRLDTLKGAIKVDQYMRASEADVFAAGDCATVYFNPSDETRYIPLATNAIREGAIAAYNLEEPKIKAVGAQGTSGIKIYDEHLAATGLTEAEAKKVFKNVKSVIIKDNYRPEFMPSNTEVTLKLVYDGDTGVLLGAQVRADADYTQLANTLSIAVYKKVTIEELAFIDQFFQPHFNKPWNIINSAALCAL
ncbi:MAG: FAD-dependent oxidoreductase [Clostridiales bacterium]|jgi:NADPH-dependent 2,4-dienoyl-CoA reductase/sulfur reductase-like enzyme|nr:FAD-dependent oxidoreductase [Clostridiales bacterium]